MSFYGWRPYVSVAQRQRQAQKKLTEMKKKGQSVAPVAIEGRIIAASFWGKSWCDNLERYSDYENRLPRGRTYVRNGSVVDLQIATGEVAAWVSGSELYQVKATIAPVKAARWKAICRDCAGTIESLVELLQGRLAKGVMDRVCRKGDGLFPAPSEIKLSCSCPDWAGMCKHVAAALYGVGARLDHKPELLFVLRGVDESDLLARAGADLPLAKATPKGKKVLDDGDVAAVFGLDMAEAAGLAALASAPAAPKRTQHREAAGDSAAPAAAAGKRSAAARGKTPVGGAREISAGTARKAPAATTAKSAVATTRKARVGTTWKTPVVTKTAAAKASNLGRTTRSRPEPKWAALVRARKRHASRGAQRSG
ncbi:MAG: SWIM zinc finger family protein [Rhodoplanes sp.]